MVLQLRFRCLGTRCCDMSELEDPEVWLARELLDHLELGPVGLFEMIWLLNGSGFEFTENEKIRLSSKVAAELVQKGKARLYTVAWPSARVLKGPHPVVQLNDHEAWLEGPNRSYVAMIAESVAEGEGQE